VALSDRDHRAVLELVGEANGAAGLADFRRCVVHGLKWAIPAEFASYNELAGGVSIAAETVPEVADWAHEAWQRYAHQNPLVARFARTRDSRPYRWSDVADSASLRATELYAEVYQPYGIKHQIAFALPSPPELVIGLALSRTQRDFGEREREMLDLARPHLIQAYRNAQLHEHLLGLIAAARAGVEAGGIGLAVVADGQIQFLTAFAAEALAAEGGARLAAGDPAPRHLLESRPVRTLDLGDQAVLVRRVDHAGEYTVVTFEPSRAAFSREALVGLGLTAREADVLAELALGHETAEAAGRLGIAVGTLHKHARAIYDKLGVGSRAQAVATAWAAAGATAHLPTDG
jgi:DNA-binding CsgD family transcriptional regulator/GAF domain-containing protein